MKLKYSIIALMLAGGLMTSCSDFFDTYPKDELSPSTFWKTPTDAEKAVVACYPNWYSPATGSTEVFFADCMSDIAYSHTGSSKYKYVGNGSMSRSSTVAYYDYKTIRRCNNFFANIDKVSGLSDEAKKDLMGQVRTIRAYRYFQMNYWFGGVPLITDLPQLADDAKLPRDSEDKVKQFVYKELDEAASELNKQPAKRGRIAKGTALAIKMRASLYWGDLDLALKAARDIQALNLYNIEKDMSFLELFSLKGRDSKEIICSMQHVTTTYAFGNTIRLFNNADGGWASFVPTQNLVDMFEMNNGLMPNEPGSGYDPTHPYANRDPRLKNTVVYSGQDWVGSNGQTRIFNGLDKKIDGKTNYDYWNKENNASHTSMIWAKYTTPRSQYSASLTDDELCPILFRYAEVLLTIAEINIEKNENIAEAFDYIDELRQRGGQIKVDRSKYDTQDKRRELIRRERCIELAGEGLRRPDLLRWHDNDGKMLAETVLNGKWYHPVGTVDYNEPDPDRRAVIKAPTAENESERTLDKLVFKPYMRYLPIPDGQLTTNPNLTQTEGYEQN